MALALRVLEAARYGACASRPAPLNGGYGERDDVVHGHQFLDDEWFGVVDANEMAEVLALGCDPVDQLSPGRVKFCNIT